jgi:hypothetical protein
VSLGTIRIEMAKSLAVYTKVGVHLFLSVKGQYWVDCVIPRSTAFCGIGIDLMGADLARLLGNR